MSTNLALAVFAGAFAATSLLLFGGWVIGLGNRLRSGPERPHVVLGNDLRGRSGTIKDISDPSEHRFGVDINGERWQAQRITRRLSAQQAPLAIGDEVIIKKIEGLTVFVEPPRK